MEEKYIYIKKGHGYLEFDTPISTELNGNDLGSTWQDYISGRFVLLSVEQLAFKEEHPNASILEVWNMRITPEPVRTLEQAKMEKISAINAYDVSDNVNQFTVNGVLTDWFTPAKRSNYRNSIDAAKVVGIESLSLFVGGTAFTISTTLAEQLLAQIQLYADACYIVTHQHIATVNLLDTIEAVDAFDHTADYPSKLNFSL